LLRGLPYSEKSIILASASARSLAESAVAAGYTPICCDFFGDEDLRALLGRVGGEYLGPLSSPSELPPLLAGIPLGIPLFWAGGFENTADTREIIAQTRTVVGASKQSIAAVRCPENLQSWMKSLPGNFPEIRRTPPTDGGRWLRKSSGTAGGLGVKRCDARGLRHSPSVLMDQELYFQRQIEGLPFSAMACTAGGEAYLFGASLQLCGWPCLGAREFLFCGNLGPVCLTPWLSDAIRRIADGIVAESGLKGVFGMDFLMNQQGLWLLEVNPRIPASHWIYDRGNSGLSVSAHLEGSEGMWQSLKNRMQSYLMAEQAALQCVLWARQPGSLNEQLGDFQDLPAGIRLADVPSAGTIFSAGTPMLSLIAESKSVEGLSERICQIRHEPAGVFGNSWKTLARQLQEFYSDWSAMIGDL